MADFTTPTLSNEKPQPALDAVKSAGDQKALPGKVPPKKSATKNKIIVIVILCVAVFVIGTLIVMRLFASTNRVVVNPPKPTPTIVPRPTVAVNVVLGEPSVYANDPQILELEGTIKALNAEIDADDLRESELTPPSLITGIKF